MTTTTRLTIINTAGLCFIIWAWFQGYIEMITRADPFHVAYGIAAVFAAGAAYAHWRAYKIDRLPVLPRVLAVREGRKAATKNMAVGDVVESLAMLGLIGSALGLLYAFGAVDKNALGTPDGIKDAAIHVLVGVKLLAGATLAATSLALWTIWNNRILETATALHNEDVS